MVKTYLKYEPDGGCGVVASGNCNVLLSPCGRFAISAANEAIVCWNLRKKERVWQVA